MTEESESSIHYLDSEGYRAIHDELSSWAEKEGEPIPPFSLARQSDIDALVATPQQRFYGQFAYPSLEEKAAIIFYTVNKRQIFLNGNKRMSTLSLLVFLGINGKALDVAPDELTKKALWLALTKSLEFPAIKNDLAAWIREHLKDPSDHA